MIDIFNIVNVSSINDRLSDPQTLVTISEDNYSAYVKAASEKILENSFSPIILLSGPSGSGKTSTAHRLAHSIAESGHSARVLSMDNYFLPIDKFSEETLPRDEDGNIDLESPQRLDIELFSEHLRKLAEGEEVPMPIFDFTTQSRSGVIPTKREKGEFLIVEGIHALNPMVTGDADKFSTCVYVAVRTRLRMENGALIHPRQIRLLRRICRDKLFRDRRPAQVFDMFASVTRGEALNIVPFRSRADIEIDTFMAHEPPAYRAMMYEELMQSADELSRFSGYDELMEFLALIKPLSPAIIPHNSLIREFIGE